MKPPIISCVVDNKRKFHDQAWIWGTTLRRAAPAGSIDPVIHHIGSPPLAFRDKMERLEIPIVEIRAFGSGPAVYCNKLQQLAPLLARPHDHVILCDADLAFLDSPTSLIEGERVRAKIVDHPNPPPELLLGLLSKFGFTGEPVDAIPSCAPGGRTHRLNANGGLYIIPGAYLPRLSESWRRYAVACLDQAEFLGQWTMHADQLGFMLAMLELKLPFSPLPTTANFPTHLGGRSYDPVQNVTPTILHYHGIDEPVGNQSPRLRPCPLHKKADQQIDRINAVLAGPAEPSRQAAALRQGRSVTERQKVVLHVGLPKTATTAMQAWFADQADDMAQLGTCYPTLPPIRANKQHYVVEDLRHDPDLTRIAAMLDYNGDAGTLLVSHEGLANHFDDFPADALARFRALTANRDVTVVAFTRAAETWLASYYRQCVLNPANNASDLWGTDKPLSELRHHRRIRRLMDHDRLLANLQEGFGAVQLVRFAHEDQTAFPRLLAHLGLGPLADRPLPVTNQSIPDWAVELMRQINGMVPDNTARNAWKALIARFTKTTHFDLMALAGRTEIRPEDADLALLDRLITDPATLPPERVEELSGFALSLPGR